MSETNIPSEIKEKIKEAYPNIHELFYRDCAEYGYQLASKTIDDLQERINRQNEMYKQYPPTTPSTEKDQDELLHEIENRLFYYTGRTCPEFMAELKQSYLITKKP